MTAGRERNRSSLLLAVAALCIAACGAPKHKTASFEQTVTVMSFNAWGAGQNVGKGIDETLAVLIRSGADIIALQETRAEASLCEAEVCDAAGQSAAAALAESMGFYLYEPSVQNAALWSNAILSRYPIQKATEHALGVTLDVDGAEVLVLNVHLADYPYQPYQLTGVPYGDAPFLYNERDAVRAATAARGAALDLLFADIGSVHDPALIVVCGDFNEPSHLDWTRRAARAGWHPLRVRYPASRRLQAAGFVDAFRNIFPDEVTRPGFTWTPLTPAADADIAGDNGEHHDRIDFIYVRGGQYRVERAAILGESDDNADTVVDPWPSDHRAVVATISFQLKL